MGLGGILASAISGAAGAVSNNAEKAIKQQNQEALNQQMADLDVMKQQRIAASNIALANQQREVQAQNINNAQQGILQRTIANNANNTYDYENEDGSISPAAYDELPDSDKNDPALLPTPQQRQDAYIQATQQTGYANPANASADLYHQSYADRNLGIAARDDAAGRLYDQQVANMQNGTGRWGIGGTGGTGGTDIQQQRILMAQQRMDETQRTNAFKPFNSTISSDLSPDPKSVYISQQFYNTLASNPNYSGTPHDIAALSAKVIFDIKDQADKLVGDSDAQKNFGISVKDPNNKAQVLSAIQSKFIATRLNQQQPVQNTTATPQKNSPQNTNAQPVIAPVALPITPSSNSWKNSPDNPLNQGSPSSLINAPRG